MMFLSPSSMLVFCNYYQLRTYFNKRPVRKKRRLRREPDGEHRILNWKKFLQRLFLKKTLKYTKWKKQKKNIKLYYKIMIHNRYNVKYVNKLYKRIKKNYLKKLENRIPFKKRTVSKLLKKYPKKFKLKFKRYSLKSKFIYKKSKENKKNKKFSFKKTFQKFSTEDKSVNLFDFTTKFTNNIIFKKKSIKRKKLIENGVFNSCFYKNSTIIIHDKLFLFHLQRILKCIFFKKKLLLKLRNIETLLPYKTYRWDDALRTSYLVQIKKKHFIRTIFRDFVFMQRIAYLEMDAQLFTKMIVNLFEMTKFHRRLIFLLKSIIKILGRFYKHIHCKIKLKGKMQYKRRTKKTYLFKHSFPVNQLKSIIEYGCGAANTPFGVLSIKTWLYYTSFNYISKASRSINLLQKKQDNLLSYSKLFTASKIRSENIKKKTLNKLKLNRMQLWILENIKFVPQYSKDKHEIRKLNKFQIDNLNSFSKIPVNKLDKNQLKNLSPTQSTNFNMLQNINVNFKKPLYLKHLYKYKRNSKKRNTDLGYLVSLNIQKNKNVKKQNKISARI